jgi:hypothetical protein
MVMRAVAAVSEWIERLFFEARTSQRCSGNYIKLKKMDGCWAER